MPLINHVGESLLSQGLIAPQCTADDIPGASRDILSRLYIPRVTIKTLTPLGVEIRWLDEMPPELGEVTSIGYDISRERLYMQIASETRISGEYDSVTRIFHPLCESYANDVINRRSMLDIRISGNDHLSDDIVEYLQRVQCELLACAVVTKCV